MQEEPKKTFKERFVKALPYIIEGAVYGAVAIAAITIIRVAIRQNREAQEAMARGAQILQNPDGSFWIVETQTRFDEAPDVLLNPKTVDNETGFVSGHATL